MLGDQITHAPVDPNLLRHRLCVLAQPVDVPVPDVNRSQSLVHRFKHRHAFDVLDVSNPTRQHGNAARRRLEDAKWSTLQFRTTDERVNVTVEVTNIPAVNVHRLDSTASTNVCKHGETLIFHVLFVGAPFLRTFSPSDDSETPNGTSHLVRPRKDVRVCTERSVVRLDTVLFHLRTRLV